MSILSYLQDTRGCILYLLSKILFESIFPTPAFTNIYTNQESLPVAGHGRGCLLGRVLRVPVGSGAVVVAVVIAATNAADAVGHLRDLLVELGAPQDRVHRRQPD